MRCALSARVIRSPFMNVWCTPQSWTTSDGTVVTIRPIRPDDLALEKAFVDRLSPATGYQRLFSSRKLSLAELKRFTDIDPQCEAALIAVTTARGSEEQIGVARFVRDEESGDAEFAIVLSDAWQHRGLGTTLLGALIAAARGLEVRRLVGTTLSTNAGMIGLGRKLGFEIAGDPHDATLTYLTMHVGNGVH
jgi:RimJ/RimL family protein N-acetyltransferase